MLKDIEHFHKIINYKEQEQKKLEKEKKKTKKNSQLNVAGGKTSAAELKPTTNLQMGFPMMTGPSGMMTNMMPYHPGLLMGNTFQEGLKLFFFNI